MVVCDPLSTSVALLKLLGPKAFIVSPMGVVLGASGAAGVDGRNFADLVHDEDKCMANDAIASTLRGDLPVTVARLRLRDGRGSWAEMACRLLLLAPDSENQAIVIKCDTVEPVGETHHISDRMELGRSAEADDNIHARFSAFVEGTESGAWAWNVRTGQVTLDERWAGIIGYTLKELAPISIETWETLTHPEDLVRAEEALKAHFSGATDHYDIEIRMRHKDGRWVWIRDVGKVQIWTSAGEPEWMYGIHADINARVENETQLSRSVNLLSKAGMMAGMGSWEFDLEQDSFIWSNETGLIFGVPADYRPSLKDIVRFVAPESQYEASNALIRAISDGEPWDLEFMIIRTDGDRGWVRSVAEVTLQDAVPVRLNGAIQDITYRKRIEDRLNEALAEAHQARTEAQENVDILRISVANSNVVPWTRVPETGESWFSENLNVLLGLGPEVVLDSAAFRALVHPEDQRLKVPRQDEMVAGHTDEASFSFRARHSDGSWRWFRSQGKRVHRSSQGMPDMLCGSLTDITNLKQNEQRLSEALAAAEAACFEARKRENMLQASAECGGMGHWTVGADPRDGWVSESVMTMLGYGRDTFTPSHEGWRRLIHADDLPGAKAAMEALVQGRTDTVEQEYRLRHADGTYHWYRAVGRKVDPSAIDRPYQISGAIMSIDRLKETEQRLAETAKAAQEVSERFSKLADNIAGAVFEWRQGPDQSGELVYYSAKLPEIFGAANADIAENWRAAFVNILPEDAAELSRRVDQSRQTLQPLEAKVRICHPDKGMRWLIVSSLPVQQSDDTLSWYGSAFDITEQMESESRAAEAAEELRRAHVRLSSVAEIAPVGLFEFQGTGRADLRFNYTSTCFEDLVGFSRDEVQSLQADILLRIHPTDLSVCFDKLEQHSATMEPLHYRMRIRHPTRGLRWLSISATPRRDVVGTLVWTGALIDVTKDVEREHELRRAHRTAETMRAKNEWQALHDGLTGLPNRRFYDNTVSARLEDAACGGRRDFALIRFDLDYFKAVNDSFGHQAGDYILKRVGEILNDSLRPGDFAARIGGDEFSILLKVGSEEKDACEIVQTIKAQLARTVAFESGECNVSASFGIALFDDLNSVSGDPQKLADAALYRAKESGRDRLELFTPNLHREILTDQRLAKELREALERDQFVPFYQPQVSAKDGKLVGVETLLRWQHPKDGLLAPGNFMHVAERLRLVSSLDRIMMQKARNSMRRWQTKGLTVPKISFNVSAGRMHEPDVVSLARELAQDNTKVTFELLESVLVEKESETFRVHLQQIREAGVSIEIDDFGSGHASIISLLEIAPSALKIDQRIVAPVQHDARARSLIGSIVDIAEALGIGTVAEGVETQAQADILRAKGCNVLQGFLFAKPLCEDALFDFAHKKLVSKGHCNEKELSSSQLN